MTLIVTDQIKHADSRRGLIEKRAACWMPEQQAQAENVPVTDVLVVNLMPKKDPAIVDLSLALGGAEDFNVRPVFLNVDLNKYQNENGKAAGHIDFPMSDYARLLNDHDFAGVIFNGASAGELDFKDIGGLDQLKLAMDLARTRSGGLFNVCWSAMAGLYLDHGVNKAVSDKKIIGVFNQVASAKGAASPLMQAWGESAPIPCGRVGYIADKDMMAVPSLDILAHTPQMQEYGLGTSIAVSEDKALRTVYMINHPEYGPDAVRKEYERDRDNGGQGGIETPYPVGDFTIAKGMDAPWKAPAHRLFNAWLHQVSHQSRRISNDNSFEQNEAPALLCALNTPA